LSKGKGQNKLRLFQTLWFDRLTTAANCCPEPVEGQMGEGQRQNKARLFQKLWFDRLTTAVTSPQQ
jgi:ribosomal protein L20